MSVVAVKVEKDKIVIGADSIIVSGWTQEKKCNAKLQLINDHFIVGSAGSAEELNLFFMYCQNHEPKESNEYMILEFISDFSKWAGNRTNSVVKGGENCYLIVFNGRVFEVQNYYITVVEDYTAIGAGRDYALTALYLGHSIENAIDAACELCVFCEGPINLFEFKRDTKTKTRPTSKHHPKKNSATSTKKPKKEEEK